MYHSAGYLGFLIGLDTSQTIGVSCEAVEEKGQDLDLDRFSKDE